MAAVFSKSESSSNVLFLELIDFRRFGVILGD